MIVINDNYRLKKNGKIYEGGMARNASIIRWLRVNDSCIEEIKLNGTRIENSLRVLLLLLRIKNEKIMMFYPTVGVPINKNGIIGRVVADIFLILLKLASKRNIILVDICDLKLEQSIDLQIDEKRRNAIEMTEKKLFKIKCFFNFASESMKEYAVKKYAIENDRSDILMNGGSISYEEININIEDGYINLVYAGTLNKGRSIEQMIDSVSGIRGVRLYLLGVGGEWIKNKKNVFYLGSLPEEQAHYIVSLCDVGLVPYDDSKLYYNIAYPTKLSFYLTAGIPFLSTPVIEAKKVNVRENVGYICSMLEWCDFFVSLTKEEINLEKKRVLEIRHKFLWDNICSNNKLLSDFSGGK